MVFARLPVLEKRSDGCTVSERRDSARVRRACTASETHCLLEPGDRRVSVLHQVQ